MFPLSSIVISPLDHNMNSSIQSDPKYLRNHFKRLEFIRRYISFDDVEHMWIRMFNAFAICLSSSIRGSSINITLIESMSLEIVTEIGLLGQFSDFHMIFFV